MTQLSGLTLAYLGDAYYELQVRKHLVEQGYTKGNDLHAKAIKYTSANGQNTIIQRLLPLLTELESDVVKRGRNAESTHKPKNADLAVYRMATGFESLIGFLMVEQKQARLDEIMNMAFQIIEETQHS